MEDERNLRPLGEDPELPYKLARHIQRVTQPVPLDAFEPLELLATRAGVLERWPRPLRVDRELIPIVTDSSLLLVSASDELITAKMPKSSFLWLWNCPLCPMYTVTIYLTGTARHRAFIKFDSPEGDLLRRHRTKIIFMHKRQLVTAFGIDFPSASEIWSLLDAPLSKGRYFDDAIGGKAIAMVGTDTPLDDLTRGWAERLEKVAQTIFHHYDERQSLEKFDAKAELEVLSHTSAASWLNEPNGLVFAIYNDLCTANTVDHGALLRFVELLSELAAARTYLTLTSEIFSLVWFSGQATAAGQAVPSTRWAEDRSEVPKARVNQVFLDKEQLGSLTTEFWKRLPLRLFFYYDELIGRANCPLDPIEFLRECPLYEGETSAGEKAIEDLLEEASANRQWTIPPGAYVQIDAGPIRAVRLYEIGRDIISVFVNRRGEFLYCSASPTSKHIQIAMEGAPAFQVFAEVGTKLGTSWEDIWTRSALGIKILLAAIIRDFWVVEDREAVFGTGIVTRKGIRLRADARKPIVVYLPRIRYVKDCKARLEPLDFAVRRAHFVTGHLRRALQASERQLLVARTHGIIVPEGFTFVRPHSRGGDERAREERDRIFRSRSALRCLCDFRPFYGTGRDTWFRFELLVKDWLHMNGYEVNHISANRRGDGGTDIQASRDEEFLLVQCKNWALDRKIGPSIVRELLGTLHDFPANTKGVIVTSSELTPEARKLAMTHGIQYIERLDLTHSLEITV